MDAELWILCDSHMSRNRISLYILVNCWKMWHGILRSQAVHRQWAGRLSPALDVSHATWTPRSGDSTRLNGVSAIFTSFNLIVPMHFNNASVKNKHHMATGLFAIISLEIESIFSV